MYAYFITYSFRRFIWKRKGNFTNLL